MFGHILDQWMGLGVESDSCECSVINAGVATGRRVGRRDQGGLVRELCTWSRSVTMMIPTPDFAGTYEPEASSMCVSEGSFLGVWEFPMAGPDTFTRPGEPG